MSRSNAQACLPPSDRDDDGDYLVTKQLGSTTCFLRRTSEGTEIWTPSRDRAQRLSRFEAVAAATDHNIHASVAAAIEQA